MTSTITESDVKTISATDFLDKFRELFADREWCNSAEDALRDRLSLITYTVTERPCSCGAADCDLGGNYMERTAPRWTYVSGPETLVLDQVKRQILDTVNYGDLTSEDADKLALAVGIGSLYPLAEFWTVTLTVKTGRGETWGSDGPDDYQIRNAIRYGRVTDKSLTKVDVVDGETA